jgi:two-component system LytT family response regulator
MQPLRTLIADDEPFARQRLKRLLADEADIEVLAECASAAEVRKGIAELDPDLVFLDIAMPEGDGFSAIEGLDSDARPHIVFVTAHDEHAVRAFAAAATDYLMKPLSPVRLGECLQRIRRRVSRGPTPTERVLVHHGYRRIWLPLEAIDCVNACGNYIEIVSSSQRYLARTTLQSFKRRLDPSRFEQVHRSHVVRLDAIRDIETLRDGSVMIRLTDGSRLRSGRTFGRSLRRRLATPGDVIVGLPASVC